MLATCSGTFFLSPKKGRLGGEASKRGLPPGLQGFTPPGTYAASCKPAGAIQRAPHQYICRFEAPPRGDF